LLVATLVGVLVGCGAVTGEAGVDDERWKTQAEAVCAETRRAMEGSRPVTGAGNPAVAVRTRAEAVKTQQEDMDELGRPANLRDEADEFVDALEDQAAALDRLADALLDDPAASTGSLGTGVTVATERVVQTADALGLVACSAFASGAPAPDGSTPMVTEAETGPVDEGEGGEGDDGPVDEG
jgi:hypothetical protein